MTNTPTGSAPLDPARRVRNAWCFALALLFLCGVLVTQSRLRDWERVVDPKWMQRVKTGRNAPFITTPDLVVDKMIELGQITASDMVYDLGCGDGRLVITAAMKTGCRGFGFDIDPQRVAEATENARLHEVDSRVTIKQADVFKVDLREADVILMYLLPWMLEDLIPQFDQCRPGTRLISHDFAIYGIQAEFTEKVSLKPGDSHLVHVYRTPLQRLPEPKPLRLTKP